MLNGSHQAIAYPGYLAGHRYVHEVARDPLFRGFLLGYMAEAGRTVGTVPGINLESYAQTLLARFSNGEVRDTVGRLCANSSDSIPKFVLPVVREQLEAGGGVAFCAMIVACWARYAEGVDELGAPIEVIDKLRVPLMNAAERQRSQPLAFLENHAVFGDLAGRTAFAEVFAELLASLHARGVRATLERLMIGEYGD
jgi:mannitol 2-dehydrogenase